MQLIIDADDDLQTIVAYKIWSKLMQLMQWQLKLGDLDVNCNQNCSNNWNSLWLN
jgi:hypothetical protein